MIRTKFALLLTFIGALPLAAQNVRQEKDTVSYMNDDPFNLEQIVVTATRTEKKIKNTPVITQVINAKQIEERGTGNIQDLLTQEVPGLNFQEVGYGTSIDIQGLGSKHILFLIDGPLLPFTAHKLWVESSISLPVKLKRSLKPPQGYVMREKTSKIIKIPPRTIHNTSTGPI